MSRRLTAGLSFRTVGRVSTDPSASVPPDEPLPGAADFPAAGGQSLGQATDYDAGAKVAGVLLTIFLPLIALIAALVVRAAEADPLRRASLRAWALVSGAWLATGGIVGIIAAVAIASSGPEISNDGPCIGGPVMGSAGQPIGNGNYRFDCEDGGSTVVHLGGG
jgi:hypothetical protein